MIRLYAWVSSWITEISSLGALAGLAAGLFDFIKIAEEVVEGDTKTFDETILCALRNPADLADPIGRWWLEVMFRDFTVLDRQRAVLGAPTKFPREPLIKVLLRARVEQADAQINKSGILNSI